MISRLSRFSYYISASSKYYIDRYTRQVSAIHGKPGERIAQININTHDCEYKIEEKKSPKEFAEILNYLEDKN